MNIKFLESISKLDKKYALSFLLGAVMSGISIYASFYYSKNPDLQFLLLNNVGVYDLKENISDLKILYKDKDIESTNSILRLYTIEIRNIGRGSISLNHYDDKEPVQLNISDAVILETPQVITNYSKYATEKITIKLTNETLCFPKLILDQDEGYTFKLLVMHKKNIHPKFNVAGLILGQKIISINYDDKNEKSIWQKIWEGNVLIHVARLFLYFISIFIITIAIFLPLAFTLDFFSDKKRKKMVKEYKKLHPEIFNKYKFIFSNYQKYDIRYFNCLDDIIKNRKETFSNLKHAKSDKAYKEKLKELDNELFNKDHHGMFPMIEEEHRYFTLYYNSLRDLYKHKIIYTHNKKNIINEDFIKKFREINNFFTQ